MHIWVDADACPKPIREILFRAAQRTGTRLTLVANSFMPTPPGTLIDAIRVGKGFDVADDTIVSRVEAGDLVITADIPLAADVIERDALALNPRGELYSRENVRQRLAMRDFLDTLRGSGIHTGGPAAMSASDRQQFANQLDRLLAKKGDG